jgi:hypothetical protein
VSSNEANNNTQGTMVRICTTEGKMTLFLSWAWSTTIKQKNTMNWRENCLLVHPSREGMYGTMYLLVSLPLLRLYCSDPEDSFVVLCLCANFRAWSKFLSTHRSESITLFRMPLRVSVELRTNEPALPWGKSRQYPSHRLRSELGKAVLSGVRHATSGTTRLEPTVLEFWQILVSSAVPRPHSDIWWAHHPLFLMAWSNSTKKELQHKKWGRKAKNGTQCNETTHKALQNTDDVTEHGIPQIRPAVVMT